MGVLRTIRGSEPTHSLWPHLERHRRGDLLLIVFQFMLCDARPADHVDVTRMWLAIRIERQAGIDHDTRDACTARLRHALLERVIHVLTADLP